jgi:ubiquinone/menaquinone biosynthesis C-methylase UbiE
MNFDEKAMNWDTEMRIRRGKVISDEINKVIDIKGDFKALEFGCGTGIVSCYLSNKFKDITLVDTSQGMIDVLKAKIQEYDLKNMTAYSMDINKGEKLMDCFDVIYSSMAFHHILDVETTLNNLFKLLGENGYLCIVDLNKDDGSFHSAEKDFDGHNGFEQSNLENILKKVGFKDIKTYTFFHDFKMVGDKEIEYSLFIMIGKK